MRVPQGSWIWLQQTEIDCITLHHKQATRKHNLETPFTRICILLKVNKTCRGNIIKLYWRILKTWLKGNIVWWIWRWEKMCKYNFIENESERLTNIWRHVNLICIQRNASQAHDILYPFSWQNVRNLKMPCVGEHIGQEDLYFSSLWVWNLFNHCGKQFCAIL